MRAGSLDRLVQFRRAAISDDGFGTVETFADHGEPQWAEKKDLSDGERWRAGAVDATVTTRFVVRWSAFTFDLTPRDELVCDGHTYSIAGLKETGKRREGIEITAARKAE